MPALTEPVAADLASALRGVVLSFKAGESRRRFAPVLHVGDPTGEHITHAVRADEALDHASRIDVVAALLLRARPLAVEPLVWLTRPGQLTWHDLDAVWLPAAEAAYAEAGLPLTIVVVTRAGWYDPRSGVSRRWHRLRQRWKQPPE